jgi:hypothetical protein
MTEKSKNYENNHKYYEKYVEPITYFKLHL